MKNHILINQLQEHNQEAEVFVSLINPHTGNLEHWRVCGVDAVIDPRKETSFSIAVEKEK